MKKFIALAIMTVCMPLFASENTCIKNKSEQAAIALEKVNGFDSAKSKMVNTVVKQGKSISTVETYTGVGGALYQITIDECKVLSAELLEEIDR